jgi:hypothetical protein
VPTAWRQGGAVSGTVELPNTGRLPGELGIEQADIRDRPGRNGGLLSQAVELAVQDVSNPSDAITMFAGRLGTDRPLHLAGECSRARPSDGGRGRPARDLPRGPEEAAAPWPPRFHRSL